MTKQLHLERTLAAPCERVFAACVEADKLAEWWGPAGFTSPEIQLDVREGGRYRIKMQPPEGEAFHLTGVFQELEAPRRLVYTFVWEEPDADDQETVVALTFERAGENTHLVLDQGPFKTEARHELHRAGWTEGLDRLQRALTTVGGSGPETSVGRQDHYDRVMADEKQAGFIAGGPRRARDEGEGLWAFLRDWIASLFRVDRRM